MTPWRGSGEYSNILFHKLHYRAMAPLRGTEVLHAKGKLGENASKMHK